MHDKEPPKVKKKKEITVFSVTLEMKGRKTIKLGASKDK